MKKTDAIKKISMWAKDWEGSSLSASNQFATQLMEFLEKELGMLPPSLDDDKVNYLFNKYVYPNYNMWDEDFDKKEAAESR